MRAGHALSAQYAPDVTGSAGAAQRLVMMADTHLPRRARDLPAELWAAVEAADVVIHAGDWVDLALLDELEARSRRVIGVYGNNDHGVLRERLPEVAVARIGGVRFAVVHETGAAAGREARCAARFPEVDVLVFGHSHIPWDTEAPGGLRLLNPGSPTDRRRQPYCTYLTAVAEDGALRDLELHRLPPRVAPAGRPVRVAERR
jgi:putative phosphoesterase